MHHSCPVCWSRLAGRQLSALQCWICTYLGLLCTRVEHSGLNNYPGCMCVSVEVAVPELQKWSWAECVLLGFTCRRASTGYVCRCGQGVQANRAPAWSLCRMGMGGCQWGFPCSMHSCGGIPAHLSVDQGDADPVVAVEPPALAAQGVEFLQWGKGMCCWYRLWCTFSSPAPRAHTSPARWDSAGTPAPLVSSLSPESLQGKLPGCPCPLIRVPS